MLPLESLVNLVVVLPAKRALRPERCDLAAGWVDSFSFVPALHLPSFPLRLHRSLRPSILSLPTLDRPSSLVFCSLSFLLLSLSVYPSSHLRPLHHYQNLSINHDRVNVALCYNSPHCPSGRAFIDTSHFILLIGAAAITSNLDGAPL